MILGWFVSYHLCAFLGSPELDPCISPTASCHFALPSNAFSYFSRPSSFPSTMPILFGKFWYLALFHRRFLFSSTSLVVFNLHSLHFSPHSLNLQNKVVVHLAIRKHKLYRNAKQIIKHKIDSSPVRDIGTPAHASQSDPSANCPECFWKPK